MLKIGSFIMSIITVIGLILPGVKYAFKPTVEIDCSVETGDMTTRATGFLYGLATEGVPSAEMVESLDISSESQKTYGGLQHPIGDVNDVAQNLDSCDYIVVYLQDCFDTWYYAHKEIEELRRAGNYDWESFLDERFMPQVINQVKSICETDYGDRVVYCLYNECDNAVWFGAEDTDGNPQFNDEGRKNFYNAWKKTYDAVRKIDPDAKIGGPGYFEYNIEKLTSFMDFCSENDCMPDVMIYHELSASSSAFLEDHTEEYRETEKKYGVCLPIIVTEYGTMEECGNPGKMIHYITAMEKTGIYGNVAFWRLANNLCDTAADDNSPNANWWLYRWYADMQGKRLDSKVIDIFHSDVANVVKYNRDRFHYVPLDAVTCVNDSKDEITVIVGGCDYESNIKLKNLDATELSDGNVNVKIECVYYKGLSGVVSAPTVVKEYTKKVGNSMKIKVDCADTSSVYRITVKKSDGVEKKSYENESLPVRYEFEDGALLGKAYTYDSAYATTGQTEGMVGGIEKIGDGVSIKVNMPSDGTYNLDIIYGKWNDGSTPNDRVSAEALFGIDGEEQTVKFKNTVKSEFTSCLTLTAELSAGEHEITFKYSQGTYVLDSVLVYPKAEQSEISILPDSDRSNENTSAFLAVAPYDGFYTINITANAEFLLDKAPCKADENGTATIYLRRGLNYIEVLDKNCASCIIKTEAKEAESFSVKPSDMTLSDGAKISRVGETEYVNSISSDAGKAEFKITVPKSGSYRMTVLYSNNREGGLHDYNVDLIECYLTVGVNGESRNVWFRNTQSIENFKTVTANIVLNEGENTVTFTNNGESKFNNMTAYAPNVASVTIAPAYS